MLGLIQRRMGRILKVRFRLDRQSLYRLTVVRRGETQANETERFASSSQDEGGAHNKSYCLIRSKFGASNDRRLVMIFMTLFISLQFPAFPLIENTVYLLTTKGFACTYRRIA